MSNFSKIVLIIIFLLSFFFLKEKTGFETDWLSSLFPKKPEIILNNDKAEPVMPPKQDAGTEETPSALDTVCIYFLALDSDGSGIYKKVYRQVPKGSDKMEYALNELLKGPNLIEKAQGAYSEIPQQTKLISIKSSGSRLTINLSSDFQLGGGTDSIYSRMMQLIKTSIENADSRKVYLYLDGKLIKFIGGEGIMVSQPLSEKSLEI